MNRDDALRLALDALERAQVTWWGSESVDNAIAAIRAALAEQPSAEPELPPRVTESQVALLERMAKITEELDARGADRRRAWRLLSAEPVAWKIGGEFAPFHPDASHTDPDYREGWNRCYEQATARIAAARDAALEQAAKVCEQFDDDGGTVDTWKHRFTDMIRNLKGKP